MLRTLRTLRTLTPLPLWTRLRDAQDAEEYAKTDMSRRHTLDKFFRGDRRVGDHIEFTTFEGLIDALGRKLIGDGDASSFEFAGAVNGNGNGSAYTNHNSSPYAATCGPNDPGAVHRGDPGCPPRQICGEDIFNMRTRGQTGFPLAGSASGFATATLTEQKPRQRNLQPTSLWAGFYDYGVASHPRVSAEIVTVQNSSTSQMLGEGLDTSMFDAIPGRVPVQWDVIDASLGIDITIGHTFAPSVTLEGYITIWGIPNVRN